MRMLNDMLSDMFVDDAKCVIDGCSATAIRQLRWSVGTKFCLCPHHHAIAVDREKVFDAFTPEQKKDDPRFKSRVLRCGVPGEILNLLKITQDNYDGEPKNTTAIRAVVKHHKELKQGPLVLSGFNGVGKTTAGAYVAWLSRGRFMRRSEWARLTTWEKDADELLELRDYPGSLVLDEVGQSGEASETVKVVNIIACERADLGKSTVLLTRLDKGDFYHLFGNDILDRCRSYQKTAGSGFFTINESSLRGREDQ